MAPNISVNLERLGILATNLKNTKDEADRIIGTIRSDVNTLVTGPFKTPNASSRFEQVAKQWADSTNQAMLALDKISAAVNSAASKHQQTDSSTAERVNSISPTGSGA